MGMKASWAVPVIVSILVIGLYSVDTQTADADFELSCLIGTCNGDANVCINNACVTSGTFGQHKHCIPIPLTGNACSDASVCTVNDVCSAGVCVGESISCDDGNVCTVDSCNPGSGCANDPVAVGTTCGNTGDGLCDLQDTCDGSGNCVDKIEPAETVCGDTVVVGVNQNCDGAGICVISSAISCGEGTTFNPDTSECEANICEAKLDVCHKNKTTMNISLNALSTHLNQAAPNKFQFQHLITLILELFGSFSDQRHFFFEKLTVPSSVANPLIMNLVYCSLIYFIMIK